MWLGCTNMAERIEVLLDVRKGSKEHCLRYGFRFPYGKGVVEKIANCTTQEQLSGS